MKPRREKQATAPAHLLGALALGLLASGAASASPGAECQKKVAEIRADLDEAKKKQSNAADEVEKRIADDRVEALVRNYGFEERSCNETVREERDKQQKLANAEKECRERMAKTKNRDGKMMWDWSPSRKTCVNLADKDLPDNDECSSAAVFEGSLKGQNCRKAKKTIDDVQARSSAISDSSAAFTSAYAGMQAMGVNNQQDAQAAQQRALKFAALAKLASAANSLSSAAQLKSAASGASDASSTITEAHKGLAQRCPSPDDQACFFQNASAFGIAADQTGYASFERMKTAARQSQEQADAANQAAKASMITGLADTLVGLQAMKMAQQAGQNAQAMAPPPAFAPPPPAATINLGGGGMPSAGPNLAPAPAATPTDYGATGDEISTFGDQSPNQINNGLMRGGPMGPGMVGKPAASGVSGGGGGGALRGGGGGQANGGRRGSSPRGPTGVGEYNMGAAAPALRGGGGDNKGDGTNPFAEALAKLFPQNQDGAPVVDTRQIASGGPAQIYEEEATYAEVTARDLSLFEQISAKYRQLNDSGRF